MTKASLLLSTLLVVPACTKSAPEATKTASSDPAAATPNKDADAASAPAAPEATPTAEAPADDPWAQKLATRKLAASGLDVGSRLSAFDIVNCETGDRYCQVCKFGSSPKIMAVGTADDDAFKKDIQDLDAIAKKYGGDDIKAFAVITELADGKAVTPKDATAAQAKADALRKELSVSIPIVVVAQDDGGPNRIWDEYYNITASRTVMFADGRNEVKFSAVGPEDFSGLDAAIKQVVSDSAAG
jgi:hypothetical protein